MNYRALSKLLFLAVLAIRGGESSAQCPNAESQATCSFCPEKCCPCTDVADQTRLDDLCYLIRKQNFYAECLTCENIDLAGACSKDECIKKVCPTRKTNVCTLYYGELITKALARGDWKTSYTKNADHNDILLFGDSQFDWLDDNSSASLPRIHNFPATAGSHIKNAIDATREMYLNFMPNGPLYSKRPSQIWIHTGANDIGEITLDTKLYNCSSNRIEGLEKVKFNYNKLFDILDQYKNVLDCKIGFCSIPPYKVVGSPNSDTDLQNQLVHQVNAWLKQQCLSKGYTFTDYHARMWDFSTKRADPYYYLPDPDIVHLNLDGYKYLLGELAKNYPRVYYSSPGSISSITKTPTSAPLSYTYAPTLLNQLTYKYVHVDVAPNQNLIVRTSGSYVNFVSIFDPYSLYKTPHSEKLTYNTPAELMYQHTGGDTKRLVLCLGGLGSGNYYLSASPQNNAPFPARLVDFGETIVGNLTEGAPNGVWYKKHVMAGETLRVLVENDTHNVNVDIMTDGQYVLDNGQGTILASATYTSPINQTLFIKLTGHTASNKVQRITFEKAKSVSASIFVSSAPSGGTDIMPAVASSPATSNRMHKVIWYRKDGNSLTIQQSDSFNNGNSWSAASPIPLNGTTLKPDLVYNSNINTLLTQPSLVKTLNSWAALAPTQSGNVVFEYNPSTLTWMPPTTIPAIGSSSQIADIYPHLAYRIYDDLLVATWQTKGYLGQTATTNYDYGMGIKASLSANPWMTGDLSPAETEGNISTPMVGARYDGSGALSVGTYVEKGLYEKLVADFVNVLKNLYDIRNPQICWFPDSITSTANDGHWVLVWSMIGAGSYGTDYDLFYSIGDSTATTWSAPKRLNRDAIYDKFDDFLPQVKSDISLGMRVIWERKRTNSSDVMVADYTTVADLDGLNWTTPQLISPAIPNAVATRPVITAGTDGWMHLFETGTASATQIKSIK